MTQQPYCCTGAVLSRSVKSDCLRPHGLGPPGSSVYGILQARILEWVAIFSSPGDLSNPGIEPASPALQVDSLPLSHQGSSHTKQWNLIGRNCQSCRRNERNLQARRIAMTGL